MEQAISKLLKIGVLLSSFFLILGAILLIFEGNSSALEFSNTYVKEFTIANFYQDLIHFKSASYLLLGTITLLLTPIARITLSLVLFLKAKNYIYFFICGISLCIITVSILVKLLR